MKPIMSIVAAMLLFTTGASWGQGVASDEMPNSDRDVPGEAGAENPATQQDSRGATNAATSIRQEEPVSRLRAYQMDLIRASGAKGPPLPIPVSPEIDAQHVKEGVLPASDDQVGAATHRTRTVAFRLVRAPLDTVLEYYFDLGGKIVVADKGVVASVTLETDRDVTVPEALAMFERALAEQGIVIIPVGTNAFKASWADEKRKGPAPSVHVDGGSARVR